MARIKGDPKPGNTQPLTERQIKFVEAYTGEARGNGTKAAKMAGYSGNSATLAVTSSQLLKSAKVIAAIEQANRDIRTQAIASRREIQEGLTAIARGNVERELVFTPMGTPVYVDGEFDEAGNPVQYSKPVPPQVRASAYETLAKMFGMLVTKVELQNASERFREAFERINKRVVGGEITDPKEALRELLKALSGKA